MALENLENRKAVLKLKELVDKIDVGTVITFPPREVYPYMVPMSRQEVDDEGNIWFLLSAQSDTYRNLEAEKSVSLSFADPSSLSFVSIDGVASLFTDRKYIDKYWNKFIEVYFEKGKDDPDIRVLKVTPHNAHYWDTEGNKIVTFLKVAGAAISGSKIDIGRQGDLLL